MARKFFTTFALNSTTANVEFDSISGFTLQTGTVHSGTYAAQANLTASTATLRQILYTSNQAIKGWIRFYIYISTLPNSAVQLARFETTANGNSGNLRLNTNGKIDLQKISGTVVGTSVALTTGVWHRIEISNDATGVGSLEARLNGLIFASGANSAQGTWARVAVGSLTANSTTNMFFDDIAVNDDSGSFQKDWPGDEKMLCLRATAAGDSNGFLVQVGGTAGAANNYTRINEVTPDDATTYNGSAVLSAEDLFNFADSGLSSGDTINVVAVGVRMADLVGADATAAFKVEIEKTASGTKAQSGTLIPNSTTWKTNQAATPWTYPLTTYQDPDGAAWTKTTLDSMQAGYIQTATNVQTIAVSDLWVLVSYTPSTPDTKAFLEMF